MIDDRDQTRPPFSAWQSQRFGVSHHEEQHAAWRSWNLQELLRLDTPTVRCTTHSQLALAPGLVGNATLAPFHVCYSEVHCIP